MKREARSTRRIRRLNQRQRKKAHVGEFAEYVFDVDLTFVEALDEDAYESLMDDLYELLEQRGLLGGGFGGSVPLTKTTGVITTVERGSPTQEDREALAQWLKARPELSDVRVHEFTDGWHGYRV